MAVLRCPYCGEKVRENDHFCGRCGKEFDKPHIDDVDTAFQDVGKIMVSIAGFIVLWFIMGLVVGFITHTFNLLPAYSPLLVIITTVLTVVVFVLYKLK